MATMTLRFTLEKETKGAVRFQEVGKIASRRSRRALARSTSASRRSRWEDTSDANRDDHYLTSHYSVQAAALRNGVKARGK